jgi:hypothetical protein
LIAARLIGVVGVTLPRTDQHTYSVPQRSVFVVVRKDERAALHTSGCEIIRKVVVGTSTPAGPVVEGVSKKAAWTQRHTGIVS